MVQSFCYIQGWTWCFTAAYFSQELTCEHSRNTSRMLLSSTFLIQRCDRVQPTMVIQLGTSYYQIESMLVGWKLLEILKTSNTLSNWINTFLLVYFPKCVMYPLQQSLFYPREVNTLGREGKHNPCLTTLPPNFYHSLKICGQLILYSPTQTLWMQISLPQHNLSLACMFQLLAWGNIGWCTEQKV